MNNVSHVYLSVSYLYVSKFFLFSYLWIDKYTYLPIVC